MNIFSTKTFKGSPSNKKHIIRHASDMVLATNEAKAKKNINKTELRRYKRLARLRGLDDNPLVHTEIKCHNDHSISLMESSDTD